jgi:hypothetical protein
VSRLDVTLDPKAASARRVEVITGGGGSGRRWSHDEKARAIEASPARVWASKRSSFPYVRTTAPVGGRQSLRSVAQSGILRTRHSASRSQHRGQ